MPTNSPKQRVGRVSDTECVDAMIDDDRDVVYIDACDEWFAGVDRAHCPIL